VAHALLRAASPLVATPLGAAGHPDESGRGTYEYVRHKPGPAPGIAGYSPARPWPVPQILTAMPMA
jgi:hypothetical protein